MHRFHQKQCCSAAALWSFTTRSSPVFPAFGPSEGVGVVHAFAAVDKRARFSKQPSPRHAVRLPETDRQRNPPSIFPRKDQVALTPWRRWRNGYGMRSGGRSWTRLNVSTSGWRYWPVPQIPALESQPSPPKMPAPSGPRAVLVNAVITKPVRDRTAAGLQGDRPESRSHYRAANETILCTTWSCLRIPPLLPGPACLRWQPRGDRKPAREELQFPRVCARMHVAAGTEALREYLQSIIEEQEAASEGVGNPPTKRQASNERKR